MIQTVKDLWDTAGPVRAILDESETEGHCTTWTCDQSSRYDRQQIVVGGSVQAFLRWATHAWDASPSAHTAIIKVRDADLLQPCKGTMDLWSFLPWMFSILWAVRSTFED